MHSTAGAAAVTARSRTRCCVHLCRHLYEEGGEEGPSKAADSADGTSCAQDEDKQPLAQPSSSAAQHPAVEVELMTANGGVSSSSSSFLGHVSSTDGAAGGAGQAHVQVCVSSTSDDDQAHLIQQPGSSLQVRLDTADTCVPDLTKLSWNFMQHA